jgi:signal transduction histidine kinase/FixJ family two-component response regulator
VIPTQEEQLVLELTLPNLLERHATKTEAIAFESLSGILLTLIIGLCVFYFSQKLIFRHLRNIADFSEHLSVSSLSNQLHLDRSSKRQNADELDVVSEALETMRLQLIEDIDNRRAMEIALVREKEENQEAKKLFENAKASDEAKSKFIATMSHEIRTPMNGIIGMVQMLQDTKIDDEQKNYLGIISRSSSALMRIINDILDFSKIESGKMQLDKETFSLEKHLNDCVQLFIGIANTRDINLISNIDPDVPRHIQSDSKRLLQVLTNLIGNAFKFTEAGSVIVNVQTVSKDNEQCWLKFSVKDTGIGIEAKYQEGIFQAYRQADDSMTRKYGGTGLGLSICKHIVEKMDGQIGVDSSPNRGSEFWFTAKFTIDSTVELDENEAVQLSGKSILYLDSCKETSTYFENHAKHRSIATTTLNSLNDINNTVFEEKAYDFFIINNIASTSEINSAISLVEKHPRVKLIVFASGKHYKMHQQEETVKAYLFHRPISPSQILDLVFKLNNDLSKQAVKEENPSNSKGLNVLVAEDNAVNRIVIEGLLKKLKVKTQFAENGKQAVDTFCNSKDIFDLIFMDCEMPLMDGFDATQKIREWEENNKRKATPIVALTAHVESSYKDRCFQSGMDKYLSKPITVDNLSSTLKELDLAL